MKPCCPHCFSPVEEAAHFCARCGRPLTSFAATDPIQSIRTEGLVFRGAAHTIRPIVVVGMWLLCVPALGMGVALLAEPKGESGGSAVAALILFALYGAILYRVTANYLRARKQTAPESRRAE